MSAQHLNTDWGDVNAKITPSFEARETEPISETGKQRSEKDTNNKENPEEQEARG